VLSVDDVNPLTELKRLAEALLGIEVGHEIIVLTWLHRARRNVRSAEPSCCPFELEVRACLEGFS
jgi:tRNA (Thr-GGU) A37 N-methylase